jgi:type I site-specific restriction endonuclease
MNLPEYRRIKLRETPNGRREVYDILRHRYVTLTPEEWVRQHFVNYLITVKGYPKGLLANEVELKVGDKRLRCDSVLYDKELQPQMIIEYKAESVALTEKVAEQIMAYNSLLNVSFLVMSNGNQHIVLHYDKNNEKWEALETIPDYSSI